MAKLVFDKAYGGELEFGPLQQVWDTFRTETGNAGLAHQALCDQLVAVAARIEETRDSRKKRSKLVSLVGGVTAARSRARRWRRLLFARSCVVERRRRRMHRPAAVHSACTFFLFFFTRRLLGGPACERLPLNCVLFGLVFAFVCAHDSPYARRADVGCRRETARRPEPR